MTGTFFLFKSLNAGKTIYFWNRAWIDLLLTMIGNTVDCSGITGAVFNCRAKLDKLSIWLETSNHRRDEKYIMSVGQAFQVKWYNYFDWFQNFESGIQLKFFFQFRGSYMIRLMVSTSPWLWLLRPTPIPKLRVALTQTSSSNFTTHNLK